MPSVAHESIMRCEVVVCIVEDIYLWYIRVFSHYIFFGATSLSTSTTSSLNDDGEASKLTGSEHECVYRRTSITHYPFISVRQQRRHHAQAIPYFSTGWQIPFHMHSLYHRTNRWPPWDLESTVGASFEPAYASNAYPRINESWQSF